MQEKELFMKNRIDEKIKEIERYLSELEEFTPDSFEEYLTDYKGKAACERYFEKIVEAIVDLAMFVIRYKKFGIPEDDEGSFFILLRNNIISEALAKKLKEAKGMRNIIAHEYAKVDDELVFNSVKEELSSDAREFLDKVKEAI